MQNHRKILSLLLIFSLCLSVSVLASGEPSGEGGGGGGGNSNSGALLVISGDSLVQNDKDGYTMDRDLPGNTQYVADFQYISENAGSFLRISAPEHVEAHGSYTAIVGSKNENYDMPNFAEIYTNDNLNPNAEGADLDYTWIGQIDWDPESPTYGSYTAVTERGQEVLSSVLDGQYSTWIEDHTGNEAGSSKGPTQVAVSGGASTLIQNTYIYSEGLEGLAVSNSGSSGKASTLIVKNSLFVTRGYVPYSSEASENLPNDPLLVTGADRTNLSGGESLTFYYDSAVVTDGWASLSTDSASGNGVDLISVNTFASALLGGYGIYADSNCRDWMYGTVLEGAEIGAIIAGTGQISIYDGDEGAESGTGYSIGLEGDIHPYEFATEEAAACYEELSSSVIAGGRWAVLMHTAGSAALEAQGCFYAKDSALITDRSLYSDESTEKSINATWYGEELSPNIQKYIEYTEGDLILLRGTNATVLLDNTTLDSYSGVLIHSVLNNDTSTPETPAEENPVGNNIFLVSLEAEGDILDEDYERPMSITLNATHLTGKIISTSSVGWTSYWLAHGYTDDFTYGYASNTFGEEAALDAFVHTLTVDPEGNISYTPYAKDKGTSLTLANGSVLTVTGVSRLESLSIDTTSEVQGTMTVNGKTVDPLPGSYEGEILLFPLSE